MDGRLCAIHAEYFPCFWSAILHENGFIEQRTKRMKTKTTEKKYDSFSFSDIQCARALENCTKPF